jgi:hypothetical protein
MKQRQNHDTEQKVIGLALMPFLRKVHTTGQDGDEYHRQEPQDAE